MIKPTRYKLEVNLTIVKEEWNGPITGDGLPNENDKSNGGYWNNSFSNERLTVNETMQLGVMDFMEMMKVLGKLHDAVKAVGE